MLKGILDSNIKTVTSGLILNLDASQPRSYPGTGTSWYDISGNNNNGILQNGPTFSSTAGGTIVFDGTNDTTNCGNISTPTTALSVFAWLYDTDSAGSTHRDFTTKLSTFKFRADANYEGGGLSAFVVIGGAYEPRLNTSWTKNTWIQVAFTWNTNGNFRLFKNGVLAASSTTRSGTLGSSALNLEVGADSASANYWKGNISNVLIYNQTLTDAQVLQNYSVTKARFGL